MPHTCFVFPPPSVSKKWPPDKLFPVAMVWVASTVADNLVSARSQGLL